MSSEKNRIEKSELHPRNKNRERYDLNALITAVPDLKLHIKKNKFGEDSVDFSNADAVKLLNRALLKYYYKLEHWEFPDENLCPPIPGRADYIHYVADLIAESNFGRMPSGDITCLDIGVGASCIYPILGIIEYGWHFIASDIDSDSINSSQTIVAKNATLEGKAEFRLQKHSRSILHGIIGPDEKIDVTVCNPPFHSSEQDARKGTDRKIKNLTGKREKETHLNFAGISSELIYDGGENGFIKNMLYDSKRVGKQCYWFTTLVSKQSNLKGIYKTLDTLEAVQVKTIPMGTGNKSTRVVAWSFLSKEEQNQWRVARWNKKS